MAPSRKSKRGRGSGSSKPGLISVLISDFVVTAILPVATLALAEVAFGDSTTTSWLVKAGGMSPDNTFIALIIAMLVVLGPLSQYLGGLFNPCDAAQMYAVGKTSLTVAVTRTSFQAAGAIAGALGVLHALPAWSERSTMLVAAPAPGVDPLEGAAAEFLLTYVVSVITLLAQSSSLGLVRFFTPLGAVAMALRLGARYTGPVLNPAAALAWNSIHRKQAPGVLQHIAVFWAAPLLGAVLAKFTAVGMQLSGKQAQLAKSKQS